MKLARYSLALCAVALAALAGCATNPTPDIRVNSAPDVDFRSYSTFGFPEQTGTDRGGYSTLVTIFQSDNNKGKSDEAAQRSITVAKKLVAQYPNDTDWSNRALRLIYMVQNKMPTWGNGV